MNNMDNIWTITLRDNELSKNNLNIAINNSVWGMKNAGQHKEIKKGDLVFFLVGVKIKNISEMRNNIVYSAKGNNFPHYKYDLITHDFVSLFKFSVSKIICGQIISNYFFDDSIIWEPRVSIKENKNGDIVEKVNTFPNRFKWIPIYDGENIELTISDSNFSFHANIIKSLSSKKAELSSCDVSLILNKLSNYKTIISEDLFQESIENTCIIKLPHGSILRPKRINSPSNLLWGRNPSIAKIALEEASYMCELDDSHQTFISKVTGKNFVEAHHLIPMEQQDNFDVSLDVPENILSLCPNCHRLFHHSNNFKDVLKYFFLQREKGLNERGIFISFEELLKCYKL